MSLSSGDRVGAYEVISLLGAGGMGQVYRARDTRLNRDVALKVLPDSFALDPDRLARFAREAQVLASLNHQNIATIHGIEEANGTKTLVLELVDGSTLADRIAQGPIPYDEALPIAKQIAAALEAAHDRGIVHRDLKPANIKLRPDGTVKVLDFGLAKALPPTPSGREVSQSPTLSLTGVSQVGVVLGTAAYMAPEQARGKEIDRRADIWAFACVFYEMLTGRQAFPGDDVKQTLARVIERDPDWRLLPNNVPPLVRTFLRRSLEKDAARRTRDIGDMRLVMDGAFDEAGLSLGESTISIPTWRRSIPWAAGVALGALIGISVWAMRPSVAPGEVTRFELNLPNLHNGGGPLVTISQDGRTLFYVENQRGLSRILQRSLSELSWQAVPGTEGAETAPFFSPDGNWMGFTTENLRTIKRVPHVGGSPVTVSRRSSAIFSPVWAPDGTIIFGSNSGLWRVSQDGGLPELIANTEGIAGGPQVLPGGRHVVFHVAPSGAPDYTIEVLTLDTGERRQITTGVYPLYAAGYLVFTRDDGSLWTVGFDASRVQTVGEPIPLPITVFRRGAGNLAPQYALGRNGTLVHIPTLEGTGTTLAWVDRGGNLTASRLPPAAYSYPRLSHDGKRLSVGIAGDIWVIDLERSGFSDPSSSRPTHG